MSAPLNVVVSLTVEIPGVAGPTTVRVSMRELVQVAAGAEGQTAVCRAAETAWLALEARLRLLEAPGR
jgi:hypothetical protein